MPRQKLLLPSRLPFSTIIPVRITDLNYGGHVGNDSILSIMHEARVQFLRHYQYDELNFSGASLIMRDVSIEFKQELFYGEVLQARVGAADFTQFGFDLYYQLISPDPGVKEKIYALARTGMVCFDYEAKKVKPVPEEAIRILEG